MSKKLTLTISDDLDKRLREEAAAKCLPLNRLIVGQYLMKKFPAPIIFDFQKAVKEIAELRLVLSEKPYLTEQEREEAEEQCRCYEQYLTSINKV